MRIALTICFTMIIATTAYAAEGVSQIDKADTAWILVSAAMVLLMTHGLALFYGGMVRKKNVLGTIMHSFIAIAIVSVQWVVIGYSLAFGPDIKGIIGGLDWAFLRGVGLQPNPDYAGTVPHLAFMIYQAMFAVITPALISGALAERIKFSSFILFIILWSTVIYAPVAHWVWGKGGWLGSLGVLDFAGGIVVHVTSGLSALAAALYIGKRKGYPHDITPPHNLPLTVIGTGILWFGWFGFNAGSALTSGALSTVAFVTSHISAVAAVVTWVTIEWLQHGKPTVFGAATASVAGLATITPAAGFVSPMSAMIIGVLAGSICYTALNLKPRLGYDDSLDAFGVHGVGGFIGTVCVGIFASLAFNEHGANGLLLGNTKQFIVQIAAAAGVGIFSFVVTLILIKIVDIVTGGIRVNHENETEGLDVTQHGESGYYF